MTLNRGHGRGNFACLHDKLRTTHPITAIIGSFNPLVMLITWTDFEEIMLETFGWFFFFLILDVFCQGQTPYCPFLRNGWSDWCETKRTCIRWILGELCGLDLWSHSWPWRWISQGQISKWLYLSGCWSDCEIKTKQFHWMLGRLNDLVLWPHSELWPWIFKVKVWNSFISGMGWPIDIDRKRCESPFHEHDIDICVAMVGWTVWACPLTTLITLTLKLHGQSLE